MNCTVTSAGILYVTIVYYKCSTYQYLVWQYSMCN